MIRNLIRLELFLNRRGWMIGGLVILGYQFLLAVMAESYMNNPDIKGLLEAKSKLIEAVGMDITMMSTYEGWMGGQAQTFFILLLGVFAAIWAASSITKERDQQTGEFLFALPYSRSQIFLSKAAAHFIQITVIAVANFFVIWLSGLAFSEVSSPLTLLLLTLAGYLTALAFVGIGYVATVFLSSERAAMSLGIGVVMVMFLMNMMASLTPEVNWLANLSFFHLFISKHIVNDQSLTVLGISITLGIYAAGLLFARASLMRQDL